MHSSIQRKYAAVCREQNQQLRGMLGQGKISLHRQRKKRNAKVAVLDFEDYLIDERYEIVKITIVSNDL